MLRRMRRAWLFFIEASAASSTAMRWRSVEGLVCRQNLLFSLVPVVRCNSIVTTGTTCWRMERLPSWKQAVGITGEFFVANNSCKWFPAELQSQMLYQPVHPASILSYGKRADLAPAEWVCCGSHRGSPHIAGNRESIVLVLIVVWTEKDWRKLRYCFCFVHKPHSLQALIFKHVICHHNKIWNKYIVILVFVCKPHACHERNVNVPTVYPSWPIWVDTLILFAVLSLLLSAEVTYTEIRYISLWSMWGFIFFGSRQTFRIESATFGLGVDDTLASHYAVLTPHYRLNVAMTTDVRVWGGI